MPYNNAIITIKLTTKELAWYLVQSMGFPPGHIEQIRIDNKSLTESMILSPDDTFITFELGYQVQPKPMQLVDDIS
jgi:hypothetical protein